MSNLEEDLVWEEAIMHVFGSHHPKEVSLKTLYFEVSKYRKLAESDFETTKYGEERYRHVLRAVLNQLVRKGWVERIRRGIYMMKD